MDIEQAVQNAKAFASKLLGPERTASIRLEEIESSFAKGQSVWLITLSTEPLRAEGVIGQLLNPHQVLGADAEREYKVFMVTKDTGEVLSMKIRLLAALGV